MDILTPAERRDAVVFIGVDRAGNVEFVKVYAVSEEKAKETLEEFFNAKGLFPTDYRLVSRGLEDVSGKKAITTRSEEELSSSLARLGLKLLSNGILTLEDIEEVYQITLVSEVLYERVTSERREKSEEKILDWREVLSLGVDTLVENLRGVDLSELVPANALILREPSVETVAELLNGERDGPIIVETKDAGRYRNLDFSAFVRIPPLSREEFAVELSARLGFNVPVSLISLPENRLNLRNVEKLAKLVEALVRKGFEREEALKIAVELNSSGP
ncbi:hypothetical protein [Thermococcus sp. 9N3]|uniref:hypothetical protein n=1 Tax=Thermococcus sp. 9N3 TaxID=163002 RepID=UPI0014310303|nr:hypothetical protein [Thermococcus sp. 9N3]NJE49268.1 hypothetical protein [Thermococcus sp. 9N3]